MFRQFFMDTMLVIEDLQYAASQSDLASHSNSSKVSLKCFSESLGRSRWQPFATWTIKLLSKFLTEGTLYVEGLNNFSCVVAACTLLCYENADLQMSAIEGPQVSLPFLLLHGGDDKVTDPSVIKLLNEKAISSDKTFKLYPGMWESRNIRV